MAAIAPIISRPAPSPSGPRVGVEEFDFGSPSYTTTAAVAEAVSVALDATLLVIDERGSTVSALPVRFRRRVGVADTATLFGSDPSGVLRVVATVTTNPPSLKLNLRYLAGSTSVPRELLASFRFLRALRRPARLGLTIGNRSLGEPDELPAGTEFPAGLVELTRSLAFVQAMTGGEFPLPPEFDDDDMRTLREAEVLLAGGTVSSRWTDATLDLSTIDGELLGVVDGGSQFMLEFVAPVVAQIGGHSVLLGDAQYVFRSAVIENYDELVEAARSGDAGADAKVRPGFDDHYEVALVAPPAIGVDLQDVRPSVLVSPEALGAAGLKPLRRDAFESAS